MARHFQARLFASEHYLIECRLNLLLGDFVHNQGWFPPELFVMRPYLQTEPAFRGKWHDDSADDKGNRPARDAMFARFPVEEGSIHEISSRQSRQHHEQSDHPKPIGWQALHTD